MKVLYANKYFFRNGGSENVMFDEIELMKRADVEVVEFAMQDPRNLPSRYARYFVSTRNYNSRAVASGIKAALTFVHSHEAVANISRLIRAEQPDILHCHNIYHQLTPSIITAAARLGVPVVLTLHDLKTVCPVYTQMRDDRLCNECAVKGVEAVIKHRCGEYSLGKRLLLWGEARYHNAKGSYDRVSKVIAPSRFVQNAVSSRFGAEKLVCIPNGIDLSLIRGTPGEGRSVLYFGRLSLEKGVESLLKAHAEDGGSWPLVVAGTGPSFECFRATYPSAEFTGHLAGDALRARIRDAAVVVAPSECQENCPLSIIEAMAHAKPMVASRIGGIPELVRHGGTGFLFQPKDRRDMSERIRTLLADADMRRRFGRAARAAVERQYTLDGHGRALLALYGTLCNRARRSPADEMIRQIPADARRLGSPSTSAP